MCLKAWELISCICDLFANVVNTYIIMIYSKNNLLILHNKVQFMSQLQIFVPLTSGSHFVTLSQVSSSHFEINLIFDKADIYYLYLK